MAYHLSQQEEIMDLVKAGECQTALERLDKQQIKKSPSYFVSSLMFQLLPQTTRSAKQLAELLLECGNVNWNEKSDEGNYMHEVMIWYGTSDLAFRAVKKLRKRDIRNHQLSSVWMELLIWFLDKHQRAAAMLMIKKGVMKYMDDDELEWVSKKILAYHDLDLWDAAWKYVDTISADMLQIPETLSERQFMKELLNKYTKQVDWHNDTATLWEISLECGADNMVEQLLKKTKAYQYLPQFAAGSEEMFDILLKVRCRRILDDVKREVFYGALESRAWRKRFDLLVQYGWKKSLQNRKKEIPIADEYEQKIAKKKYSSDRAGHLEKINDRTKVRFLKGYEQKRYKGE